MDKKFHKKIKSVALTVSVNAMVSIMMVTSSFSDTDPLCVTNCGEECSNACSKSGNTWTDICFQNDGRCEDPSLYWCQCN